MNELTRASPTRKEWVTPRLEKYGTVENITRGEVICKKVGFGDDLALTISLATGC